MLNHAIIFQHILGPQPPININALANDNGSVIVKWDADNLTGFSKLFKIHVTYENTIYEEISGCDYLLKKTSVVESTDNQTEITNLEPFSKYSVRIFASNDFGFSEPSKKHFFNTKPSSASAPRKITIQFASKSEDGTKISGTLSWKAPCKLNGLFSLYTIALKGSKAGFSDQSIKEASSFQNFTIRNLRRGFNYEAKVQAVNKEFFGASETIFFTAPSGSKLKHKREPLRLFLQFIFFQVPLEKDLKAWTTFNEQTFDQERFEIFIRRGIFRSEIGDVTGIAFLIYLAVILSSVEIIIILINDRSRVVPTHLSQETVSFQRQTLRCFQLTEMKTASSASRCISKRRFYQIH